MDAEYHIKVQKIQGVKYFVVNGVRTEATHIAEAILEYESKKKTEN